MHIVLFEPEIPPNTGNVARLCAALGVPLHLIEPLGFSLEDRYLKRAGLDYWPHVELALWPSLGAYWERHGGRRHIMTSSRAGAVVHEFAFAESDALVFGPETRGLPEAVLARSPFCVRIPLRQAAVRSLNLSTAVGIVLYEAIRIAGQPPL